MIEIVLRKDGAGRLRGLLCRGHAGFADEEHGGDIVCAAVSALTGYLGLTLAEVLEQPGAVEADDGHFRFSRPQSLSPADQRALDVVLEGWVRSVRALEENYSGWVTVEETHL
jgi:uncharacterized protein YsxB (DUF464 family)